MDFNEITNLIGSLGFPIVCCVYLIKKDSKSIDLMTATLNEMKNTLTELSTVNKSMVDLITHFLTKGSVE